MAKPYEIKMMVIKKIVFCLFLVINLYGCSLLIAATEEEEPDLSKIHKGADRTEVENILGAPIEECEKSEEETLCKYEYNYECQSSNIEYGMVLLYDIFTLGLMEIVATPIAMIDCGKEGTILFAYDEDNKVIY